MEITITKLEAARRQLRTAIELWFADGDAVSIHTLAYASHEIIHSVYRKRGFKDLLYDSTHIKPEDRSEFASGLAGTANFFKHARSENETATKTFRLAANDLFLLMSVIALDRMQEARADVEQALMFWHFLHNPQWFPGEMDSNNIPAARLNALRELDRVRFLKTYLEGLAEKRRMGVDIRGNRIEGPAANTTESK